MTALTSAHSTWNLDFIIYLKQSTQDPSYIKNCFGNKHIVINRYYYNKVCVSMENKFRINHNLSYNDAYYFYTGIFLGHKSL